MVLTYVHWTTAQSKHYSLRGCNSDLAFIDLCSVVCSYELEKPYNKTLVKGNAGAGSLTETLVM